jgi:hypothetical protein
MSTFLGADAAHFYGLGELVCVVVVAVVLLVVIVEIVESVDVEVGSLQPNQPGVWHVVIVVVEREVVDALPDDVLSRQCHHPGVSQVCVRVYDLEVEVAAGLDEVVLGFRIFPSKRQLKQSTQSTPSGSHFGTSSYTSITSLMTPSMP